MKSVLALLLFGTMLQVLAAAPPELTPLPPADPVEWKEVRVAAGELVWFTVQPASTWEFLDDTFQGRAVADGSVGGFVFPKGTHRVTVTAKDGSRSRYKFVAGDGPPVPTDSLVKDLRDRYAADTSATKRADMASLAALYTLMVSESAKADYATAAALNQTFVTARDGMLSDGKGGPVRLLTVRQRCGQEIAAIIGDQADTPITPELRKALAAGYTRLSGAVTEAAK